MPRLLWLSCVLVGLSSVWGCGDGDLIENPMLDRWCGDKPCAWEVTGRVERVGTWHTHDYAIALQSRGAVISQVNATLDATDATCLGFSMIADVEPSAEVYVELDFLDDGVIDFSQRIVESHWERRTFLIRTPSWYEGVRFIVRKAGRGRAVLAELRPREAEGCIRPPVELDDRPTGAKCEDDGQCAEGRCVRGRCSNCRTNLECGAGSICGISIVDGQLAERCVRPGSAVLGEPCSSAGQCATGTCCDGLCSECCPGGASCDEGGECARAEMPDAVLSIERPWQCGPLEGSAASGRACIDSRDCRSQVCQGAETACASCADIDLDAGVDEGQPDCLLDCSQWIVRGGVCR